MLQSWVIIAASFAYLGLLFAIAYYADRRAEAGRSVIANPYVYSLSLGVYATAWTFYGSVGRAASDGIGFLPIYLGPTLMIALWWIVLRKILRISRDNRITSLADFIASRYGKSAILGGTVTIIAVLGVVPYISLQLKAVSNSFTILIHYPDIVMPARLAAVPMVQDTALWTAVILAAFTIAFGTRHLYAAEHHQGMVAAIAFESLVKLLAFLAVGIFITFGIYEGFGDVFERAGADPDLRTLLTPLDGMSGGYASWVWLTILSMLAIMFLPRQFQVAVIENLDERHLEKAIWLFPLYMLLINIFVLPIAFGGRLLFPAGSVDADTFVLALPMAQREEMLALLVFLGGLSAATGMVIVETIALSTMVCNDLVMPILLRLRWLRLQERRDLTALLLGIRRGAILLILLLGYLYFRVAGEAYALVSIGLISFAAVAQFAPSVFGGIFWKGGTHTGALLGLLAGFGIWAYTLLLPAFARSGWIANGLIEAGPFGIQLLKPQELFGLSGLDPITHAMIWSMIANVGFYVLASVWGSPSAEEHRQASLFVDVFHRDHQQARAWRGSVSSEELHALLKRFVGAMNADAAFEEYGRARGLVWPRQPPPADAELVHFVESKLAGAIGGASARVMIASTTKEEEMTLDDVRELLNEASQVVLYSHMLEQKSRDLETATEELRSANAMLKELDHLKDDFVSMVSHELRTPLTSIRAFSEILREDPNIEVAQRNRFLDIIVKETERLTRLINQVLDLSKIESGRVEWYVTEVDVGPVIEEVLSGMNQTFCDHKVGITKRIVKTASRVQIDRDRLVQVLLNLLSNAVKFCQPDDPRIAIEMSEADGFIRIQVCDNGPGVRPEDRTSIFEKFRQVSDTSTGKPQGTGLGLPISKHIIEHFGGRLWVDSRPGKGACFSFVLPISAAQASVPLAAVDQH
jgi:Na+/proline symporter/signal transduction histidine kinase